jgi:hypothetical protein
VRVNGGQAVRYAVVLSEKEAENPNSKSKSKTCIPVQILENSTILRDAKKHMFSQNFQIFLAVNIYCT